jgi:CNT family concentrative nucleoside transporter
MERLLSLVGIAVILGVAYFASTDRKAIQTRTLVWGLGLQVALALFVLKTAAGKAIFGWLGDKIGKLLALSFKGSEFVFGPLGAPGGGESKLFVFAFQVLPTIVFVAALFAILYHLGAMQPIVALFAKVMTRLMGASGAESLNASAGIFMGQTEAPLTVRPYLPAMTESELLCVMTSGMAHISAGIMGAYIFVAGVEAQYLLASVLMTAPGSILLAKMFVPETKTPQTSGSVKLEIARQDANLVGAAARGTVEGMQLAINVAAMLISFLALIALVNLMLGVFNLTLETLLGYAFAPVAILLGVPMQDARAVGSLLGTRLVANEFLAYSALGPMKATLDPRSFVIATFALCGFANFGSIGIQIGGIGALIPERKDDLARLGVKALVAGTLANFLTACIAGALL